MISAQAAQGARHGRSTARERERALRAAAPSPWCDKPTFSFVIACRNEAADIGATIAAVEGQRLTVHEIIVVDGGSTDGTLCLLRLLDSAGRIRLIEEGRARGVAAARNTGIDLATGDVVVVLNADVRPELDFTARLSAHYRAGYEAVSVQSRVENTGDVIGRYMQAEHAFAYAREQDVGWTEGFSVRRDLAASARFPEEIPGAGGEDVVFFDRLLASGAAWTCDFSIGVPHTVPATPHGFWAQWRGRGNAVPYAETRLNGMSRAAMTLRRALASAWTVALGAAVLPAAAASVRRARTSPRGLRDAPAFWLLMHVQRAAHRCGEWQSVLALWRQATR